MSLMIASNNIRTTSEQLRFFKNFSLALKKTATFKWQDENYGSQFGLVIKNKSLYFFKKRIKKITNIKSILDYLKKTIEEAGINLPINFICIEITRGGKWNPPPYFYKDIVVFPVGSIGLNWAKRNYFATSSLGREAMAITSADPNKSSGLLFAVSIKRALEKCHGNPISAGQYFLSDIKTVHCSLIFSKKDNWYLFLRSKRNQNGFILRKQKNWIFCSEKINSNFSKTENVVVL